MIRSLITPIACAACLLGLAQPVSAEKLALSFLPPDLPPSNVCNADPEVREEGELQDGDLEIVPPGDTVLDDVERIRFLVRDIRVLSEENAAEWATYIGALIDRRAEIDARFSEVDAAFVRAELLIKAGQLETLTASGLIAGIAAQSETLSNNQKVALARFMRRGIGVEADPEAADALLVEAGFAGSSGALLGILRRAMAGDPVDGWDLGPEETAILAFGGVVGQLNRGLCGRAERMAREYLGGDILEHNADLAYAWRVFAADMGGVQAAWRVVEHHLNGSAPQEDHATLVHYLNQAISGGVVVSPQDTAALVESGATTQEALRQMLGRRLAAEGRTGRRSAAHFFELQNNPIVDGIAPESDLSRYLEEVIAIPGAPGVMFTRLAREVLVRQGRWAGEASAIALLKEAVARGDAEANVLLAQMMSRYRGDTAQMNGAEQLLLDAVSRYGHAPAMRVLDHHYRCRVANAPRLSEAAFWSDQYRASGVATVSASAGDVAKMHATLEPDTVARIQSDAVRNHSASKANLLQMMQSDPLVSNEALRYWASRVASSDNALEDFIRQEYELAATPVARDRAIALFRRIYLDVGQSISLDLAVALVEHAGRDTEVAAEIRGLLERSALRGEGAAIRLLQRLTNADPQQVFDTYREVIERRGDFLAMMYAGPFVSDETFHDYIDRAVSVMNCSSKDVSEIADAYAARGLIDDAGRWLQVGLALEGGHVLSKLGLTDSQSEAFEEGLLPLVQVENEGAKAIQRAFLGLSDPYDRGFDPEEAGRLLVTLLDGRDAAARAWAFTQFARVDERVQAAVQASFDLAAAYEKAAGEGDAVAQYEFGMYLRHEAETPEDLTASAEWLLEAAKAGKAEAMAEYGFALGFGLGVEKDLKLALIWLQKAQGLGNARARDLAHMLRATDID